MAFVLVADGDTDCAERASEALIAAGHASSWVGDAQQARALLRWRPPDLIVLDEAMPDETGGSLLHALRSSEACREIPIILMGAADGTDQPPGRRQWAPQARLHKPCDPRLVVWRVNHALDVQHAAPKRARIKAWLARKHAAALDRQLPEAGGR